MVSARLDPESARGSPAFRANAAPPPASATLRAQRVLRFNSSSANFRFFNNLLVTTGGVRLLDVAAGQSGIVFQENDYWSSGRAFSVTWGGTNHSSLSAWINATGQENRSERRRQQRRPAPDQPRRWRHNRRPGRARYALGYELQPDSPVVDAGLDLFGEFGIDPGPRDSVTSGGQIGACRNFLLRVTATDAGGLTDSFDVPVAVLQVLSSILVTPSSATVRPGLTQQYVATHGRHQDRDLRGDRRGQRPERHRDPTTARQISIDGRCP